MLVVSKVWSRSKQNEKVVKEKRADRLGSGQKTQSSMSMFISKL